MATPGLLPNPAATAVKRPAAVTLRDALIATSLFLLTLISTTAVGVRYMYNFRLGQDPLTTDADLLPFSWVWQHRELFVSGLPFSLTLIAILLAHEFGHYFACRYYGVRSTLPLMLPAPSLSGTFGAVIRLRSRIQSRAALIAIGASGPIAGFIVAIGTVMLGLRWSTVPASGVPSLVHNVQIPLIIQILHAMIRHADPSLQPIQSIVPHPVLSASWIGILITALNLIPAGQLDGGHIIYSISPRLHRLTSVATVLFMAMLGIAGWVGWLLWSVVLLLPGMGHPRVKNNEPYGVAHLALIPICFVILILSGTPRPFAGYSLLDMLAKYHWHWPL
ncbi:Peptidase family M50 [Granulicella rosea]|uniref:Peptidase family M50 n=1 Tax=Granulicella rosea TaxID=474952 RepID=A0A239J5B5_9BACT|nr:site-2 protease family protein [Granulicella rosea]SNT00443.1 Peptidase family M50 [Granulicella rosea]